MNPSCEDEDVTALRRLLYEMQSANRALLAFDGAEFARHAEQELCLAAECMRGGNDPRDSAIVASLRREVRRRRILLRSTQRSVTALVGLLQTAQQTYESALLPRG